MLRRYEIADEEWAQISDLLPPEQTGKRGRPGKENRTMLNGMIWIARSGDPRTVRTVGKCIQSIP